MMTHKELDIIFYTLERSYKRFTDHCILGGFAKRDDPQLDSLILKRWDDLVKIEKAFVLRCLYDDILEEDLIKKINRVK